MTDDKDRLREVMARAIDPHGCNWANNRAGSLKGRALQQATAALAALEAAGWGLVSPEQMKRAWYVEKDCKEGVESPEQALDGCVPGNSSLIEACVVLRTDRWQLVLVTDDGELCPCGKPEGCGDFLGVECRADRSEVRRQDDLPAEWRR